MYHVHGSFEIMALTFLTKRYIGSENFTRNEIKKSEKLKTALKEVAKAAVIKTGLILRKNRAFIYNELIKIKKSLNISPGLLGLKFPQILSALSFAKKEILMHFTYSNQIENDRKDVQKYYNPQDYVACDVVPLLEIIFELNQFIEKYYYIIVTYNFEYLALNDCEILKNLQNKLMNSEETNILKPLIQKMNENLKFFVDGNKNKSDNIKSDNKINEKINKINNKNVVEDKTLFRYENEFKSLSVLKIAKNKLNNNNNIYNNNSNDNDVSVNNAISVTMKNEENLINFQKSCIDIIVTLTTIYNKQIRKINNFLLENEENEHKINYNVTDIARKDSIKVFDKIYNFVYESYNRALLTTENSLFSLLKEYVIPYEICYFERELEICCTDSLLSKSHTQNHVTSSLVSGKSFRKINDFFSSKNSSDLNDEENKNKNNNIIYESEIDRIGSFDITDYNDSGNNSPITPNSLKNDYNSINNNKNNNNINDENDKNNSITSIPSNKKNSPAIITNDNTNGFIFFTLQSYSILNVHSSHRIEEIMNLEKTIKSCDLMSNKISLFVKEKIQTLYDESLKLVNQTKQIEIANKIEQITILKNDLEKAKKKRLSLFVFGGNLQTKNEKNNNDKNSYDKKDKDIINIFDYESNMNKMFQKPGEESKYTKKRENRGLLNPFTITELISVKKKLSSLVISSQNFDVVSILNKPYNVREIIVSTIMQSTKQSLRNVFNTLKERKTSTTTKNFDSTTLNKEYKNTENKQIGEKIVSFLSVCRDSEYLFSFIHNSDFFTIFREILYGEDGASVPVFPVDTDTSTHLSSLFPSLFPSQKSRSLIHSDTDIANNSESENANTNAKKNNISGNMKDIKHKYPLSFIGTGTNSGAGTGTGTGTGTNSGIDPNNAPLTPRSDTHTPHSPLPGSREVLAAAHIYLENCAKPTGIYSSKTVATTSIYYSDSNSPMRQRIRAENGEQGVGGCVSSGIPGITGGTGTSGVPGTYPPSLLSPTESVSSSSQSPAPAPSPTPSPVTPTSTSQLQSQPHSPAPPTLPPTHTSSTSTSTSTSTSPLPGSSPLPFPSTSFSPSPSSPSPFPSFPLPSNSPKPPSSGRLTRPLSLSHNFARKNLILPHFLSSSNDSNSIQHNLSTSSNLNTEINNNNHNQIQNQNVDINENISLIKLLSSYFIENILTISGIESKVSSNMDKNTIFWIPSQKIFFSLTAPCVFDKENITELCRLIGGRGVAAIELDIIELIIEKVSNEIGISSLFYYYVFILYYIYYLFFLYSCLCLFLFQLYFGILI